MKFDQFGQPLPWQAVPEETEDPWKPSPPGYADDVELVDLWTHCHPTSLWSATVFAHLPLCYSKHCWSNHGDRIKARHCLIGFEKPLMVEEILYPVDVMGEFFAACYKDVRSWIINRIDHPLANAFSGYDDEGQPMLSSLHALAGTSSEVWLEIYAKRREIRGGCAIA